MNNKLENLVKAAKTDVSGKWISRTDIVDYTNLVILQCISLLENSNDAQKIKKEFGLTDEKKLV